MDALKPEMTLSEVARILEESEGEVWEEYIGGIPCLNGEVVKSSETTLQDIAPNCRLFVYVERGGSEGIYLDIEGLGVCGIRNHALTCKTLGSPDCDEKWDECWLSAGRIARALGEVWW